MTNEKPVGSFIDVDHLPDKFPTQRHDAAFWEGLGRAVATFGFLEETLAKAIFAFTATRPYPEAQVQQAYDAWLPTLERALIDPLGALITSYENVVRNHPHATIATLDDLVDALRQASKMRNVLCHGSWGPPSASGSSVPFYVDRKKRIFDTAIDHRFLTQVQRHVAELACAVISTVTQMGWQFPSSQGPGKAIWKK